MVKKATKKMAATKRKPAPKKPTAKAKNSRVVVSRSSGSKSLFGRFSTRAKVLFVAVFAVVGGAAIYASFADSPQNYLVGMGSAGAITMTTDADGNEQVVSGSSTSFQITPDNMLQCTNVNSGNVTTAQLTPEQVSNIANQVIAAGITSQSDTVVAKGQGVLTGTWVTVNTNGVNKTVNIVGTPESTDFGRAVKAVAKDACKLATKPQKSKDAAAGTGTKLSKVQGEALAAKLNNVFNAKAYADSGYAPRMETSEYVSLNYWRDTNGVSKNLKYAACLQDSARIHAKRMADANTMSHQLPGEPDIGHRVNNNCPSNFVWVGENIAWNSDTSMNGVALLMDLMATEKGPPPANDHRLNDLSLHYDYVGAAAYYDQTNGKIWIVNDFASFNNAVPTYDPIVDWNLDGKSTVSTTASDNGSASVTVKPGATVYYHYRIANTGSKWASFTQYRTWKHYAANGSIVSNTDEHAESSDGIGWGKHGSGWAADTTKFAFSGRYYDDFTADSGAATIPSNAQNGEKFCRLIHYTNATGPSTGAQNSNEACAVVKV